MVKIADVILGLRSRLGDTDVSNRRYSDPEMIDAVNSALAHLSEELLCFRRTWRVPCADGVGRYELPEDFLRPISVNYNDALITDVESMEHRMNRNGLNDPGVSYDLQTLHVFPSANVKEGDVIEFYYNYFETVNDGRDTVALPNNAKEAVICYALHLLYQNPILKLSDRVKLSTHYLQLYEVAVGPLKSRVRMNAQSKNMRSNFVKV